MSGADPEITPAAGNTAAGDTAAAGDAEAGNTAAVEQPGAARDDIGARLADAVDWRSATLVGRRLAPAPPKMSAYTERRVYAELARAAEAAEGPVREVTGLVTTGEIPPARVVDRPEWIEAAALSMRNMILDVPKDSSGAATSGAETSGAGSSADDASSTDGDEPGRLSSLVGGISSALEQAGGVVAGVPTGAMLAYLSSAILGQYDPFTGPEGTLILVAPNVVAVERSLRVRPSDFRLWVCLHEVTHRVQFTAAPWLRDYMRESVESLVEPVDVPIGQLVERLGAAIRADRSGANKSGPNKSGTDQSGDDAEVDGMGGVVGILRATRDPQQREVLDNMLALGTLLEGHADHVMDAVGPQVVPTVADIRAAFDNRRQGRRSPLQRLVRALLGLDVKMAQYLRGKAFVDAVVEQVGMERFNTVWTDATTLPRLNEIEKPELWIARVLG